MQRKIRDLSHDGDVIGVLPSATIHVAAQLMAAHRCCALLVTVDSRLLGILTEQDVVRRVVAQGLDPATVTVSEVMTPHPDTIHPAAPAIEGLQMMEDGGYRHLPVVSGMRVVGLVSRVDFQGEEKTELESERRLWERLG